MTRNVHEGPGIDRVSQELGLRVAFTPVWEKNPYHNELSRALLYEGVSVEKFLRLKDLYQEFRDGKTPLDIVHLHGLPFFLWRPVDLARYGLFVARLLKLRGLGIRVVWTIHDYRNHDAAHWRIEHALGGMLARQVDALIVHGPAAKELVLSGWGRAIEPRLHVIPHGNFSGCYPNEIGRSAARRQFGYEDGNRVLLFLGWIRPYKGVSELVRIFRERAGVNDRLIIAGQPIDEKIGREVAALVDGESRICYRPQYIKDEDIQVYMNAADAVVLPYGKVFTSGAAVLAMSFGRACVAPRIGGVVDALDSEGAVLFDPAQPADLERAVVEVMAGKHNLAAMGRCNRLRADQWTWSSVGQATAALYRSCTVEPAPRRAN